MGRKISLEVANSGAFVTAIKEKIWENEELAPNQYRLSYLEK